MILWCTKHISFHCEGAENAFFMPFSWLPIETMCFDGSSHCSLVLILLPCQNIIYWISGVKSVRIHIIKIQGQMHRKIPGFFFDGFPFRRPWDPSNMWKVKIIIRSLLQHLCLLRPDQGPLDNVQSMLPKSYLSMSFFSSPSSTSSSSSSKSSLGVQNMRQRVSTAARHFFYQALLHDLRDF